MTKTKSNYFCSQCGAQSPKWVGKCYSCGAWNTYTEEFVADTSKHAESRPWQSAISEQTQMKVKRLDLLKASHQNRINTGETELDRALGGGLVKGAVVLLAGQPGIGKSTLVLQLAINGVNEKVLYVSGEESETQIKIRAQRLVGQHDTCFLLAETNVHQILINAAQLKPSFIIIDSIQTMFTPDLESAPGTVGQIRQSCSELIRYAKETGTPVIIIGHITKEGEIAGPKLLEHMVDVVLQFQGEKQYAYRILRTLKNRFGSTDELSIFEMRDDGLTALKNPSELLLSQHDERLSGSAIGCTVEGLRPLLIETQALVSNAVYGTPQRIANGFDSRRMSMLLAVLEKRCGFFLGQKDVFLNIAGGIKIVDPALDMAVIAALISSHENRLLHRDICFAGEVGLSGEIRAVAKIDLRIQEAARMGFKAICLSKYNLKAKEIKHKSIKIVPLATVNELYEKLFSS